MPTFTFWVLWRSLILCCSLPTVCNSICAFTSLQILLKKKKMEKISPFYYTTAATSQTNKCPPPVTWEQWYSCKCQSSATENPTTCHIKLNSECLSRSVLVSWYTGYLIFKTYSTEICKLHRVSPEKSRQVIYKKKTKTLVEIFELWNWQCWFAGCTPPLDAGWRVPTLSRDWLW